MASVALGQQQRGPRESDDHGTVGGGGFENCGARDAEALATLVKEVGLGGIQRCRFSASEDAAGGGEAKQETEKREGDSGEIEGGDPAGGGRAEAKFAGWGSVENLLRWVGGECRRRRADWRLDQGWIRHRSWFIQPR